MLMTAVGWREFERLTITIVLNQSCNSVKKDVLIINDGKHRESCKLIDKSYNNLAIIILTNE